MSKDIEFAKSELNSAFARLIGECEGKVLLSSVDDAARQIGDKLAACVKDAAGAAAFAARNPTVLESQSHGAPDGVPVWKLIAWDVSDFIVEQLNGPVCVLFIQQFEVDFDPVFEMQHFGREVVDEYEDFLIDNEPQLLPLFLGELGRLRVSLKEDVCSSQVLDEVGRIASMPEFVEKHQLKYRLLRGAYHVRSGFEQRQVALACR